MVCREQVGDDSRVSFVAHCEKLCTKLITDGYLPFDSTADQLCIEFMRGRVPPCVTHEQQIKTHPILSRPQRGGGFHTTAPGPPLIPVPTNHSLPLKVDREFRLVRRGVCRMHVQDEEVSLYHVMQNARLYQMAELSVLNFPLSHVDALDCILESYPSFVNAAELPGLAANKALELANELYAAGLLEYR